MPRSWRLPYKAMCQLPDAEQVIRRLRVIADETTGHKQFLRELASRVKEINNRRAQADLCEGGWSIGQSR